MMTVRGESGSRTLTSRISQRESKRVPGVPRPSVSRAAGPGRMRWCERAGPPLTARGDEVICEFYNLEKSNESLFGNWIDLNWE